jgi:beta-aspartyl-peptidase (threonine type)
MQKKLLMKYITHIYIIIFSLFAFLSSVLNAQPVKLVIHGGAGTIQKSALSDSLEKQYRGKLREALIAGYTVLEAGGTSVEAVKTAINIMEDSPLFNAGKGSVFTHDGKNEMDASIMEGNGRQAGAVAGVMTVKNPINAAIAVMYHSPHVMLSGKGAELFAKEQGLALVDPSYFYTKRRAEQLQKALEKEEESKTGRMTDPAWNDYKFGTVGAVALDRYGNLAAGTSTGGMTNKRYGRIGDSPIIGAGTYADNNTCGVSCTGHGEYFIRGVVAYDIAALIHYKNYKLKKAARKVVQNKLPAIGGSGGIIAMDKKGNIAMEFNTKGMYRGYIETAGKPVVFIFRDE